jgi:hypothetical protein
MEIDNETQSVEEWDATNTHEEEDGGQEEGANTKVAAKKGKSLTSRRKNPVGGAKKTIKKKPATKKKVIERTTKDGKKIIVKHKKDYESFSRFITYILKGGMELQKDGTYKWTKGYAGGKISAAKAERAINSEGVAVVDDMIKQLHNTIVMTAKALAKHNNRVTLSTADVALAVKIHTGLVGDVYNNAGGKPVVFKDVAAFADQAITRWQASHGIVSA